MKELTDYTVRVTRPVDMEIEIIVRAHDQKEACNEAILYADEGLLDNRFEQASFSLLGDHQAKVIAADKLGKAGASPLIDMTNGSAIEQDKASYEEYEKYLMEATQAYKDMR